MSDQDLRLETADGQMSTFISHPSEGGPFPAVVVYMDGLGFRDELKELGRRIAAEGYYAIVPDLYHRFGERVTFDGRKLADPESDEIVRMLATIERVSDEMAMADTASLLDHAAADPSASDGPKGTVGFCMGGRFALCAMADFADQFTAGSTLHPSFVVTEGPDSVHLRMARIRGELYVGLGAADSVAPPEQFEAARTELEKGGVRHEIEVHDDADHGYMIPGTPIFQDEASRRSWERTFELFGRTLQPLASGAA